MVTLAILMALVGCSQDTAILSPSSNDSPNKSSNQELNGVESIFLWDDAILWNGAVLWSDAILWSDIYNSPNSYIWSDAILWNSLQFGWDSPLPNSLNEDVDQYYFAVNLSGGDITESNWAQMTILDVIDASGNSSPTGAFTALEGGIHSGISLSLAVRPFYENSGWGPVGTVVHLTVTPPQP